eukprot:TRINITY_DN1200_c0_g1_i3.p1 TRINITY_DN1200_c0_g1~~TRINITY_DN1200_c0_g1_i3.p1  ORF type:complete len:156 (+),score=15.49 TRINITY_DN1200_c0_g1_i3:109-576(+)
MAFQPRPAPKPKSYGTDPSLGGRPTDSLFSGPTTAGNWGSYNTGDLESGQRAQMVHNTNRVDDMSARLARTRQVSEQNEEMGRDIMGALESDRAALERARKKTEAIDENMDLARWVMVGIARRMVTNKLILIFLIFVLLAAICVIVYLKWIRPLT